ncbi:MAG: fibronectin-binding autotransporter adhesin, partial [Bacteroidota bacterium]|nr:fibronectin-binding autotransporter adhesin [Bacteroidota bacterium]
TDPYLQPVTFTGVPNNGNYSFAVGANQYNLIGNPYPSALDADAFINDNSSIISGALYFWTHSTPITQSGSKYVYSSNDYATYNISGGVKTFGNFNSPEWVDLNNNKTIDPGEWSDKNGNGIVDKGEWVDANNNQILETNEWNDVNNNGIAETNEWTDANNNNIFETGEWIDSNTDKVLNLGIEVVTNKPSGKIAAGQSFFVGNATAGNFNFTNAMRVAGNNSQFFKFSKTATLERNRIWLNLTNTAGAFKQLLIGYLTGASNDWDNLYDGPSFDGNTFIDFYSINNTSKLTIQGRALPFEITDSVPLGYRSTIEGPFEIAIDQTDGLLSSKEILLEDKKTGTTHNLTQEKYSFTAIKGVENDRFVLKYAEKPIIKEAILVQRVAVYVKDKKITVNSTLIPIEKILVYDVSGRKIYEKESIGLNEYILENFANNKQFLIVKTILKDETVTTEKVIF